MADPARHVAIPFGDHPLSFDLPAGWRLRGVVQPAEFPKLDDPETACRQALAEPIGAPPLVELARGKRRVALVVDDVSRPTPAHQFVAPVSEALAQAGVPDDAVTVVFAVGLHQPMTEPQARDKLGAAALARYRWINHDCRPGEHLVYLGKTRRGSPVHLHRAVAEADLVVTLGSVEPHIIASFGGGAKMLVPGVAGARTITATHKINATARTLDNVGRDPDANPMRRDLEEAVALLSPPVFIVNAVMSGDGSIARLVAGDHVKAHRAAAQTCGAIFGARVRGRADIVIAGSHPMDYDMRQGVKAVANTIRALRPGGVMLCLMACRAGIGDLPTPRGKVYLGPRGMQRLAGVFAKLLGMIPTGMKEEERFFTYFTLHALRSHHLVFYAPTIPATLAERLPFLRLRHDLRAALTEAASLMPQGETLVFPHGGATYPVLE